MAGEDKRDESRLFKKIRQLLWLDSMGFMTLGVGLAALTAFGLWYSARPEFCTSCHFMQPYYDSWKHSTHNNVACGTCHYPPDVQTEMVNHFRNLSQVAKYFTATYGTRPWAEVEDASCLRGGCHEKRLLKGKVNFGTIVFDHTSHLTEMRRKKTLRCTSCHSQMVQGQHMSVTASTCILCHFKEGRDANIVAAARAATGGAAAIPAPPAADPVAERATRCVSCHDMRRLTPATSRSGKPGFSHKLVVDQGIACQKCHGNAVSGDGTVSRFRCHECHAEPTRVNKIKDTEFMHLTHVTKRNVTCLSCHAEITHQVKSVEENFRGQCQSCHTTPHKAELDMYAGRGGAGVPHSPDVMYQTKVTCKGCHLTHKRLSPNREVEVASEAACISCHNVGYANMLARWQGLQGEIKAVQGALAKAQVEVGGMAGGPARQRATAALARARQNIGLVSYGKAVHNPAFAARLVSAASKQIDEALSGAGSAPAAAAAVPHAGDVRHLERGRCLPCHVRIPDDRQAYGLTFDHDRHLARGFTSCGMCHTAPASGKPNKGNHGKMTMDRTACMTCHHSPSLAKAAKVSCTTCHESQPSRQAFGLDFQHERHVTQAGLACATCHALGANGAPARLIVGRNDCMSCHHGQNVQAGTSCRTCHERQPDGQAHGMAFQHRPHLARAGVSCQTCHAVQGAAVKLAMGRSGCMSCHHQKSVKAGATCQSCHEHPARVQQGRGVAGVKGTPSAMAAMGCEICHTPAISSSKAVIKGTCKACHAEGDFAAMVDGIPSANAATMQELGKLAATYRQQRQAASGQGKNVAAADRLYDHAQAAMAFTRSDRSGGVHNMGFISAVLDQAKVSLEQAIAQAKGR